MAKPHVKNCFTLENTCCTEGFNLSSVVMPEWIVTAKEAGLRPFEFFRLHLTSAPEGYLRRLMRGKARRNGGSLGENPLQTDDIITLPESARVLELIAMQQALDIDILFESPDWLVIDKRAGIAVHRGQGHEEDNLVLRLKKLLALRKEYFRPAPVHRLDRDTSGAVLFAKNQSAASALGKSFMKGLARKHYLALACGEGHGQGVWRRTIPAKGKTKEAITHFQFLSAGHGYSLVSLELETGRTHQIRQHLALAGHPLAGDHRYAGKNNKNKGFFLHCHQLSFYDPLRKNWHSIAAPLPQPFSAALQELDFPMPSIP